MHSFKYFVSVCAVLVLIFATDNEVTAAPHPCLWVLDYDHTHTQVTTPPTTAKPDLVEEFNKLKQKKTNQLEKLLTDWIIWGPRSENQKNNSRSPVEKMISSYLKFLVNVVNML